MRCMSCLKQILGDVYKRQVTNIAFSKHVEIDNKLKEIAKFMVQKEEPVKDMGKYCFSP